MGVVVDTSSSMQMLDRENERRLKRSIADSKYGSMNGGAGNNYEAEMLKIGNQAYQVQMQMEQMKAQEKVRQKAEYDRFSLDIQQLVRQLDDPKLDIEKRKEIIEAVNIKKNRFAIDCPGYWEQIPDEYKQYLSNFKPVDNFNRSGLSVINSVMRDSTRMSGGRFTFRPLKNEDELVDAQFNNQYNARLTLANQPKRENYAAGEGSLNGKKLRGNREWIMGADDAQQEQDAQQGQPQQDAQQDAQQGQPQQDAQQGPIELDYDDLVSLQQGDIEAIINKYGITDEQSIEALNTMTNSIQLGSIMQDKHGNDGFVNNIEMLDQITAGMTEQARALNRYNNAAIGEHRMALLEKDRQSEQNIADNLLKAQQNQSKALDKQSEFIDKATTPRAAFAASNFIKHDAKQGINSGGDEAAYAPVKDGGSSPKDDNTKYMNEVAIKRSLEQHPAFQEAIQKSGGKYPETSSEFEAVLTEAGLWNEVAPSEFWPNGVKASWGEVSRHNLSSETKKQIDDKLSNKTSASMEELGSINSERDWYNRGIASLLNLIGLPELAADSSKAREIAKKIGYARFLQLREKGFQPKDVQEAVLAASEATGDYDMILDSTIRHRKDIVAEIDSYYQDPSKADKFAIAYHLRDYNTYTRQLEDIRALRKQQAAGKVPKDLVAKGANKYGNVTVYDKSGKLVGIMKNGTFIKG